MDMKTSLKIILMLITGSLIGQNISPEYYGFRHLRTNYKKDTVDILIKSKPGDELKKKPLFLFCQGSLPIPLIIYDEQGIYGVFPFNTDSLVENYHLAIIGKPYVPIIAQAKTLGEKFMYLDTATKKIPTAYSNRNFLDYYVNRNIKIIDYLQKLPYIEKSKLIVVGHSEGSTVASKLALKCKKITHLIYIGGNPLGRIMSMIEQKRMIEKDSDSTSFAENEFNYWIKVVDNQNNMDNSEGDTPKATFDFSIPPIQYLAKLSIPVLVCYGTKDWSSPYNDYLRVEMIRQKKKNFSYQTYIGLDHNFFPIGLDGKPDYSIFNWDKVANQWLNWLKSK